MEFLRMGKCQCAVGFAKHLTWLIQVPLLTSRGVPYRSAPRSATRSPYHPRRLWQRFERIIQGQRTPFRGILPPCLSPQHFCAKTHVCSSRQALAPVDTCLFPPPRRGSDIASLKRPRPASVTGSKYECPPLRLPPPRRAWRQHTLSELVLTNAGGILWRPASTAHVKDAMFRS